MDEQKRQRGVIKHVSLAYDDHHLLVFNADIRFEEGGGGQGFQIIVPPEMKSDWVIDLCQVFGVGGIDYLHLLEGEECYALRSFSYNNAPIIGLESVRTGRRFTREGFMKKHRPEQAKSELAYELESRCREIQFFIRRIREERARMKQVREDFTDWETADATN